MRRLAPVLLTLAVSVPGEATAQTCGLAARSTAAAVAGVAHYDIAGSRIGAAVGIDATLGLPGTAGRRVSVRGAYRTVLLGGGAHPHLVRGVVVAPLPISVAGFTLCGTGHAGVSAVAGEASAGVTVVAGGVGLRAGRRIPLARGAAAPFAEVRALAARGTGSAFDVEIGASGLSLGLEAGVEAILGGLILRLAGSVDGFDDGLGTTPYPAAAAEVGVGVAF